MLVLGDSSGFTGSGQSLKNQDILYLKITRKLSIQLNYLKIAHDLTLINTPQHFIHKIEIKTKGYKDVD